MPGRSSDVAPTLRGGFPGDQLDDKAQYAQQQRTTRMTQTRQLYYVWQDSDDVQKVPCVNSSDVYVSGTYLLRRPKYNDE